MPVYASLAGGLIFLLPFVVIYVSLPGARRAMRWTGGGLAPAGPLSEWWFNRDYWQPAYIFSFRISHWTFGVEDALFSFAFAGIAAGIFFWAKGEGYPPPPPGEARTGGGMVLRLGGLFLLLWVGITAIDWNSIYASMATFAVLSSWLLLRYPGSFAPALAAGAGMAALLMIYYVGIFVPLFPGVFSEWFKHEFISGVRFLGVPVEEPAWALFAGVFCALVFPFLERSPQAIRPRWERDERRREEGRARIRDERRVLPRRGRFHRGDSIPPARGRIRFSPRRPGGLLCGGGLLHGGLLCGGGLLHEDGQHEEDIEALDEKQKGVHRSAVFQHDGGDAEADGEEENKKDGLVPGKPQLVQLVVDVILSDVIEPLADGRHLPRAEGG